LQQLCQQHQQLGVFCKGLRGQKEREMTAGSKRRQAQWCPFADSLETSGQHCSAGTQGAQPLAQSKRCISVTDVLQQVPMRDHHKARNLNTNKPPPYRAFADASSTLPSTCSPSTMLQQQHPARLQAP
jgi:hypothetical protein